MQSMTLLPHSTLVICLPSSKILRLRSNQSSQQHAAIPKSNSDLRSHPIERLALVQQATRSPGSANKDCIRESSPCNIQVQTPRANSQLKRWCSALSPSRRQSEHMVDPIQPRLNRRSAEGIRFLAPSQRKILIFRGTLNFHNFGILESLIPSKIRKR